MKRKRFSWERDITYQLFQQRKKNTDLGKPRRGTLFTSVTECKEEKQNTYLKTSDFCPLLKRDIISQKTTPGAFCRQTLVTFKETPSKHKAVCDKKSKPFKHSPEDQQNADPKICWISKCFLINSPLALKQKITNTQTEQEWSKC